MPEAIAIEKPALIATQWPLAVGLFGVWPNNSGLARRIIANTTDVVFMLRLCAAGGRALTASWGSTRICSE
jgi:hypothetical protein